MTSRTRHSNAARPGSAISDRETPKSKASGKKRVAIHFDEHPATDTARGMLGTESKKDSAPATGKELIVGGVRISFPFSPYPSQIMMMSNMVKALSRQTDALLESPTGSGKTMALLCASLAWQQYEAANLRAIAECEVEKLEQEAARVTASDEPGKENVEGSHARIAAKQVKSAELVVSADKCGPSKDRVPQNGSVQPPASSVSCSNDQSSDDEFQPSSDHNKRTSKRRRKLHGPNDQRRSHETTSIDSKQKQVKDQKSRRVKPKRPPTIFFGTRTHKQIAQVVSELKRTAYGKDISMTILSSREHTCINRAVSKGKNKNEDCTRLLKDMATGRGCHYYRNVRTVVSHPSLRPFGTTPVWDIEDLLQVGQRSKGCPYFAAREMLSFARIVFCPYNYLIDPSIRSQLNINLEGNVVIIDEAHNIEDSAREAATFDMAISQLKSVKHDLERLVDVGVQEIDDAAGSLLSMISNVETWMVDTAESFNGNSRSNGKFGLEHASKQLTGEQSVAVLETLGITKVTVDAYQEMLKRIRDVDEISDDIGETAELELSNSSSIFLQGFFITLNFLLGNNGNNLSDFTVILERKVKDAPGGIGKILVISLGFWCFNPALTFRMMAGSARSVILTSGTLAPLSTFSSELATEFPFRVEASHVVDNSQVWATALSHGPGNQKLHVTYKNVQQLQFQDEIGDLLFRSCEIVPFGVLVFVPSYGLLDTLSKRWKATGLWAKLRKIKTVVAEPRGGSSNFESDIKKFFRAVDKALELFTNGKRVPQCTGGLMLAVTRGKVSEGIDFPDAYARAVINIGIPYPNTKDPNVVLKRKFNDRFSRKRNLLSGDAWYETQAFRALNQGLGRCIRHRHDWGAILLVDCRFESHQKHQKMLSKWVRQLLVKRSSFSDTLASLRDFVSFHTKHLKCHQSKENKTCSSRNKDTKANDNSDLPIENGQKLMSNFILIGSENGKKSLSDPSDTSLLGQDQNMTEVLQNSVESSEIVQQNRPDTTEESSRDKNLDVIDAVIPSDLNSDLGISRGSLKAVQQGQSNVSVLDAQDCSNLGLTVTEKLPKLQRLSLPDIIVQQHFESPMDCDNEIVAGGDPKSLDANDETRDDVENPYADETTYDSDSDNSMDFMSTQCANEIDALCADTAELGESAKHSRLSDIGEEIPKNLNAGNIEEQTSPISGTNTISGMNTTIVCASCRHVNSVSRSEAFDTKASALIKQCIVNDSNDLELNSNFDAHSFTCSVPVRCTEVSCSERIGWRVVLARDTEIIGKFIPIGDE